MKAAIKSYFEKLVKIQIEYSLYGKPMDVEAFVASLTKEEIQEVYIKPIKAELKKLKERKNVKTDQL